MGHSQKHVSKLEQSTQLKKCVTAHSQKNGSQLKTCIRVRKMNTVRKMCHT